MARWNPTHNIIKNFAFGDPVKQYKTGTQAYLSGDALDFAALNHCATMIKPEDQVVVDDNEDAEDNEKVEGGDVA